ncbi:hypothetical protein NDU88_004987 [Pleurodeles waltl]|uniref:Uncharacterized protein n=1 Tax=Pleurodeles waltl TaxID=8319 RepID=A0AAV7KZH5_PLEWA|nr:hypothetical protein NDU88_004987 [Pleurodeles waltl]
MNFDDDEEFMESARVNDKQQSDKTSRREESLSRFDQSGLMQMERTMNGCGEERACVREYPRKDLIDDNESAMNPVVDKDFGEEPASEQKTN